MTDEEIVKEAHEFWVFAKEYEREIRQDAERDLRFLNSDQWNEKVKRAREADNRPALTLNKLWPYVNQVCNDYAESDPAIAIHPVGDGADKATADVMAGLIRHIEYESDADDARDLAFFYTVACSMGVRRLTTKYEDDTIVDDPTAPQVISIDRIQDPLSVIFDPYSKRYDRSDSEKAMVLDVMSEVAYKKRWPNSKAAQTNFFESAENPAPDWIAVGPKGKSVQVAEYWKVENWDATRVQMADGVYQPLDDLDSTPLAERDDVMRLDDETPVSRTSKERKVTQYIINGVEVLEKNEWIGRYIPLIPSYGREMWVQGKRIIVSLIRNALDAQVLYNWAATNEAEILAMAPRNPYLLTPAQVNGFENDWKDANNTNNPYLKYNPDPQAPGSPIRTWSEPPIVAVSNAKVQASQEIMAIIGMHEPDLGQPKTEQSGVAIQKLQTAGDVSTFHFFKNAARSLRLEGRQLLDLIPKVYNTARQVRIMRPDNTAEVITVNQMFRDEKGTLRYHQLDVGRYDVTVNIGPSATTKREDAFNLLTNLARAYPILLQIAGDLIFRNSDIPGADEIADRLKKMLPPQLQEQPNGLNIPPQVQQQLAALMQQNQELQHALAATQVDLKLQLSKTAADNETKKYIAELNGRIKLIDTQLKHNHDAAKTMIQSEMEAIAKRLEMLHETELAPTPDSGAPGLHPVALPEPAAGAAQ